MKEEENHIKDTRGRKRRRKICVSISERFILFKLFGRRVYIYSYLTEYPTIAPNLIKYPPERRFDRISVCGLQFRTGEPKRV